MIYSCAWQCCLLKLERFQIFWPPLVQPNVGKFLHETKQRKISKLLLLVQKFIFLTGRTKKENCESTLWQENNNCRTDQNNSLSRDLENESVCARVGVCARKSLCVWVGVRISVCEEKRKRIERMPKQIRKLLKN